MKFELCTLDAVDAFYRADGERYKLLVRFAEDKLKKQRFEEERK